MVTAQGMHVPGIHFLPISTLQSIGACTRCACKYVVKAHFVRCGGSRRSCSFVSLSTTPLRQSKAAPAQLRRRALVFAALRPVVHLANQGVLLVTDLAANTA
jgi:hypothetical protein